MKASIQSLFKTDLNDFAKKLTERNRTSKHLIQNEMGIFHFLEGKLVADNTLQLNFVNCFVQLIRQSQLSDVVESLYNFHGDDDEGKSLLTDIGWVRFLAYEIKENRILRAWSNPEINYPSIVLHRDSKCLFLSIYELKFNLSK